MSLRERIRSSANEAKVAAKTEPRSPAFSAGRSRVEAGALDLTEQGEELLSAFFEAHNDLEIVIRKGGDEPIVAPDS